MLAPFRAIADLILAVPEPIRVAFFATAAAVLVVHAVRCLRRMPGVPDGPTVEIRRLIWLVRGAGALLLAVCLGLVATGWALALDNLVGLGVLIGLEEAYEFTLVLGLLRMAERIEADHAAEARPTGVTGAV